MTPPPQVLDFDSPTIELNLPPLGRVGVREPGMGSTRNFRHQSALKVNYSAYADSVLHSALRTSAGVDMSELTETGRRRLMCAVVRLREVERHWKGLYGTHLSLDERFFAVMRAADAADAADIRVRLREIRERNFRAAREGVRAGAVRSVGGGSARGRSSYATFVANRNVLATLIKPNPILTGFADTKLLCGVRVGMLSA